MDHPCGLSRVILFISYESAKNTVRLLFWSGQSFDEPGLSPVGKNKGALVRLETKEFPHLPILLDSIHPSTRTYSLPPSLSVPSALPTYCRPSRVSVIR